MSAVRHAAVPAERWERWLRNFEGSHGTAALAVRDGRLHGAAGDGSTFAVSAPFGRTLDGSAPEDACAPPERWGVLLVRRGGFAVARLEGRVTVASKVGRRHVQGRTKAGGQSQQRFARRRANQARAAYDAAGEHAAALLGGVPLLVTGGDRSAVTAVLRDPRLEAALVVEPWLAVGDPRRDVLERAIVGAGALQVVVTDA